MRCEVDLSQVTPDLHLFHSRRKCRRFLHRLGWKWNPTGADAQTWCAFDRGGMFRAVVLFEADSSWHAEAALLCHEAVHVAEETTRVLGIDDEECRAYMAQSVSYALFKAHGDWKRKHGRCG